jgi:hypothetical protein
MADSFSKQPGVRPPTAPRDVRLEVFQIDGTDRFRVELSHTWRDAAPWARVYLDEDELHWLAGRLSEFSSSLLEAGRHRRAGRAK